MADYESVVISISDDDNDQEAQKTLCTGSKDEKDIPECWTEIMFQNKIKLYPWLICQSKMLGCEICQKVKVISLNRNVIASTTDTEWTEVKVKPRGSSNAEQLTSLRKKIHRHKSTFYHQEAERMSKEGEKKGLETMITARKESNMQATERIFRTVYKIAKLGRPFTDLPSDIELQVVNGLDMGRTLHSNVSCAEITQHIASEMRKKVTEKVLSGNSKLSILIDESTTDSKISVLIVYIRASLEECEQPLTFFLDLVELSSTTAAGIYEALMKNLSDHGFSESILRERLICFASDGASVMLGRKSGVASKLVEKFPNILIWHCMNHRLELSVGDALEEVCGVNEFQFLFDKLYSLYHASAKNRRELTECCEELSLQILRIGKILNTRWVASSFRSIKAVWRQYGALHKHFSNASADPNRTATERSMFTGLANRIGNATFVHNLGTMYDALQEISEFSLLLEERNMTLPKAEAGLRREIRVLKSLARFPGPASQETIEAINSMMFKGVPLIEGFKHSRKIDSEQFFLALAESIEARMCCLPGAQNKHDYQNFLRNVEVLQPTIWPEDCDIRYGEKEVGDLCLFFKMANVREVQRGMRDYVDGNIKKGNQAEKDDKSKVEPTIIVPKELQPLVNTVNTVVVSTAECERGFSQMNYIRSSRCSLGIRNTSASLFIKCVGPPLRSFRPEAYVKSWAQTHSLATSRKARAKQTGSKTCDYESIWKVL